MNPVTIYVCGWVAGLFVLRAGVFYQWRNPSWRADMIPLRHAFADQRGLLMLAMVSCVFWWMFVVGVPYSMIQDRFWTPEEEDDD